MHEALLAAGVRSELDARNEKLGFKIREAQVMKVPYMVVLGNKEMESGTVSPRFWDGKQFDALSTEAFIAQLKAECGEQWGL